MKKIILTIVSTLLVVGLIEVGVGYYLIRHIPPSVVYLDYVGANIEKLTTSADTIVLGKVIEILPGKMEKTEGIINRRLPTIYTDVVLAVSSTLKGAPEKTITVRTMGGTAVRWDINFATDVSGEAHFEIGEEVLLFLAAPDRGEFFALPQGYYLVPYGEQGKYEIIGGMAKSRGEEVIPIDTLIKQVKNILP